MGRTGRRLGKGRSHFVVLYVCSGNSTILLSISYDSLHPSDLSDLALSRIITTRNVVFSFLLSSSLLWAAQVSLRGKLQGEV